MDGLGSPSDQIRKWAGIGINRMQRQWPTDAPQAQDHARARGGERKVNKDLADLGQLRGEGQRLGAEFPQALGPPHLC